VERRLFGSLQVGYRSELVGSLLGEACGEKRCRSPLWGDLGEGMGLGGTADEGPLAADIDSKETSKR
jgi:hypothetical protein